MAVMRHRVSLAVEQKRLREVAAGGGRVSVSIIVLTAVRSLPPTRQIAAQRVRFFAVGKRGDQTALDAAEMSVVDSAPPRLLA